MKDPTYRPITISDQQGQLGSIARARELQMPNKIRLLYLL